MLSGDGDSVMTVSPSRPEQWSCGQERSARCADDRFVRCRHADTSGTAAHPAVERLAEILAVRRQLSNEKVAAENAGRLLEDPMLQRLSRRRSARLSADVEKLDERLVEIVASDAALAHRYRLLISMRGVGPVLACTL